MSACLSAIGIAGFCSIRRSSARSRDGLATSLFPMKAEPVAAKELERESLEQTVRCVSASEGKRALDAAAQLGLESAQPGFAPSRKSGPTREHSRAYSLASRRATRSSSEIYLIFTLIHGI